MGLINIFILYSKLMKILSWDVGIKHLAYCLIEYSENTKILDWDNINLLEDENLKCYGFINSENKNCNCDKLPKFEYINGNDKYYFCALHKKQVEKIDKNSIDIKNYKGQVTCEIIKSNKEVCGKASKFKIIDGDNIIHSCKLHCKHFTNRNNVLKKIVKPNASKAPIELIKMNLVTSLDKKITNFKDIDYVLIENQPSMKNPKMKSVAETLYCWFMIRGMIDKKLVDLKNIFYLSPSNKLKIDDKDLNKEIDALKDKSKKYKFTKQSAVIYTKKMLDTNDEREWDEFLSTHSKKDDLCDSYLQGLYFLNNKNKFI
jgi:hypothetical protein